MERLFFTGDRPALEQVRDRVNEIVDKLNEMDKRKIIERQQDDKKGRRF